MSGHKTSNSGESAPSPTEQLVHDICGVRFEKFDRALVEGAKSRIIDTIGCLIAGADAPGNSQILSLVKDWGGKGEATILIHGGKVPAHNAAMVNCIMARSFDAEPNGAMVEDTLIPSHISGTTIMTALAAGEMAGASGKDMLTAMLAGENLACRLLAAGSAKKRVDNIGTVNVFGATAITAKLLGLSQDQMRNAFGIALDSVSGSYQNVYDGNYSFKLSQGLAARAGIMSAQLAQKGWLASPDPFLGRYAFYYLYADEVKPEILTKDLGEKYYTEAHFKPYVSCRYNHSPVECVLSLLKKHRFNPEDIARVNVYVSGRSLEAAVARPFEIGDHPYANALFSYRYTVANTLLRHSLKPEHFSEEAIRDPKVNPLIKKISLAELPSGGLLGAKVEIILLDGTRLTEEVDVPKGDQQRNPMSADEIIAKFWANVEYSGKIKKGKAEALLTLLARLETLDNLNRIIEMLVA